MPDSYTKRQEDIDLAVVASDVKYLIKSIDGINEVLKHKFVTQEEFEPIRRIIYGLVATILIAFIGAVIALIIK